jgi:hypothetical protein
MKNKYLIAASLTLLATACQQPPTTTVTTNTAPNANISNANSTGANSVNGNVSSSTTSSATIETREPDQYQATIRLKLETTSADQNTQSLPTLVAQVARNGADKRMEFTIPGGEKVVYLDRADKRLLIIPNRKQYAELDSESTGFDVRRMMTPAQMIEQAKSYKGIERVGEEQFNGRTAIKYRYGAVTDTKSQAGQVATESYFLVDKDTGLPLRSELVSETTSGGNVQGLKGLRVITETSEIQTTAPAELFAEPTDYRKATPEEVKGQVNAIFGIVSTFLGQVLRTNAAQPQTQPGMSPATAPNTPAENAPRP